MKTKLDKSLTDEERKLLDQAKEFSLKKDFENTLKPLYKLVEIDSSCAIYHGMLGNILWELGRLEEAELVLIKAVSLSPESESESRNLFHVLWEQEKTVDALNEVRRYTKLTGSNTYDEIIKEINED